ncbi:MAG: glycosyltransferase, partial [Muribaculum intestinale]|nr:glycosyltransferase [Muribaculum intestinale]
MILSFDASQELSVAFAAIACIAAVALIVIYIPMLRRLHHALSDSPAPESGTLPVSVIVYTYANSKGLEEVIKALHEQHYDGSTEIIVVNDGKDNGVEDFL